MAKRPIFIPTPDGPTPVRTVFIDFQWYPGLAVSQKQKSIASLHDASRKLRDVDEVLEVSSKSLDRLGVSLSAFNLLLKPPHVGRPISVECAFQGSKVFQKAGPFIDLYEMSPRDAKRDIRLQNSGQLTGFHFMGRDWLLEPQTAFYDWLYICALSERQDLIEGLTSFSAFTDIEFNPAKSINCQAYSVALFVSLQRRGVLHEASSPIAFLDLVSSNGVSNARQDDIIQPRLI